MYVHYNISKGAKGLVKSVHETQSVLLFVVMQVVYPILLLFTH